MREELSLETNRNRGFYRTCGCFTAGALADMIRDTMTVEFRDLAVSAARVHLVDLGHVLLAAFSETAHDYVAKVLQHKGVELNLGVRVTEVGAGHVTLSDGSTIATRCVVWGGGIKSAPIGLAQGADEAALYRLAVDALIHLHRRFPAEGAAVPRFGEARALREVELLLDWLWPAMTGARPSRSPNAAARSRTRRVRGPVTFTTSGGVAAWARASRASRLASPCQITFTAPIVTSTASPSRTRRATSVSTP